MENLDVDEELWMMKKKYLKKLSVFFYPSWNPDLKHI